MALRCVLSLGSLLPRQTSNRIISKNAITHGSVTGGTQFRQLSVSSTKYLKEIIVKEEDGVVMIEGKYRESPRASLLIQPEQGDCNTCILCSLDLNLKHTDVLVLSQFLRDDGCMLPKRVTRLCRRQQRRVTFLVAMSQKAGLMPNLAPAWSKRDPKLRNRSKKYNRYFDESTLPNF